MVNDYLDDLLKEAKKESVDEEDHEEKIASEIKKDDLKELEKKIAEKKDLTLNIEESTNKQKTTVEKELEKEKKVELKKYGKTTIYEIPGKSMKYYFVPTLRPTSAERKIINTIKEATTRLISVAPFRIRSADERRIIYKQKILDIIRHNPSLNIPPTRISFYADAVVREMVGYGLIDDLIKDDFLEEIMIVGSKKPVFVFHREYEMMQTNIEFFSEQEIEDLINKIAREVGRRVDVSSPLLDARLMDGSRVNATIPPASISGGTLTIRKFREDPYSIIDLIRMGTLNSEAAAFLWICVDGLGAKPANMLISGGTGSGKTTLLNVLASFIPERERIITIEDTAELNLPLKHWIRLEGKPPGLEGTGELKLDILTKNSLRMRPDRIIVGEVRHEEAFTLFTAINTGHDGAIIGKSIIQLSDGNLIEIEKLAAEYSEKFIEDGEYEFAEINDEIKVPSLNKKNLKIENKKILRIWKKKTCEKIKKIKLKSGKIITLTNDHPIYKINNGIIETNVQDTKIGDFIAVPNKINIQSTEEIENPYYLGLVYGDGHIGQESIEFTNKNIELIQKFEEHAKTITENKITRKNIKGVYKTLFFDKKQVRNLNLHYKIPIGNKTKKFKLEKEILCSSNKNISQLLKGLFDSEAHINLHSNSIQFSTSNIDLATKLPLILQRFGIFSSTNKQNFDGKGNFGPYYRISIYGKENIIRFKKNIGFYHSSKKINLEKLIQKTKNSIDIFPNLDRIIRNLRSENGLTQKEFSQLVGNNTPSLISSYETKMRSPTRKGLTRITSITKGHLSEQLKILAESQTRFEKIISIEEIDHNDYLYDLTIEDNHNYIANGIIISNCVGTVHANSPEETIIRVTSPPMNVPNIMLSGLDLIIVEHRYHDRKKGTIRRISEIAELYGGLEGKPKTQTLFQRDAVKDDLERTILESDYLKQLRDFTGMTKDNLEAEINIRKQFLEQLVEQNIRDLKIVSKKAHDFNNKRKFGEKE
jgi:archaeal flagellar protein FlaI